MIVSRSNSMIISAACHISSLRKAHPPFKMPMSINRGDNTKPVRNVYGWSPRHVHGMSAIIYGGIGLQPLIPPTQQYSALSNGFATPSEQKNRSEPFETIPDVKTSATRKNSPIFDKQAKQHLHPSLQRIGAEDNSVNLGRYNKVALLSHPGIPQWCRTGLA